MRNLPPPPQDIGGIVNYGKRPCAMHSVPGCVYCPEPPVSGLMRVLRAIGAISIIALIVVLLAGCASGVQVPREVKVPTPVACIAPEDKPARPQLLSDGDILILDSYRAVWALWGDRLEREAYEQKLAAIVEGCSRIPAVRP